MGVKISGRRKRQERSSQDKTFTRIFPTTKLSHFIDIALSIFTNAKSRRFFVDSLYGSKKGWPVFSKSGVAGVAFFCLWGVVTGVKCCHFP